MVVSRRGDTETSTSQAALRIKGPRLRTGLALRAHRQARRGAALEKLALGGEARAVAFPFLVRLAPGDEAAEVRAAG